MTGNQTISLLFFLFTFYFASSRNFENPILENIYEPSVIKVKDTYYMVTASNQLNFRLPIYSSPDLQTWKFENYVFTAETLPIWPADNFNLFAPKIHFVNGAFNVYYQAISQAKNRYLIGVARSLTASPTGPYEDSEKPLFDDFFFTDNIYYPELVNNGELQIFSVKISELSFILAQSDSGVQTAEESSSSSSFLQVGGSAKLTWHLGLAHCTTPVS